jgi:hypothetical protein
MSSSASIEFEPDTIGISAGEWRRFCDEFDIRHSPQTVGGDVYYAGDVELCYQEHELRISTYQGGPATRGVARLGMLAWLRWGGQLRADPEVRALACGPVVER